MMRTSSVSWHIALQALTAIGVGLFFLQNTTLHSANAESSAPELTTPTPQISSLPRIDFSPGAEDIPVRKPDGIAARSIGNVALGCYATTFRVPVGNDTSRELVARGISEMLAQHQFTIRNIIPYNPTYGKATSISFENEIIRGVASVTLSRVGAHRATLLACYWNRRNQQHCQPICEQTLRP